MRILSIVATFAALIASVLTLLPEAGAYRAMLPMVAAACAAVALLAILFTRRGASGAASADLRPQPAEAEAARPVVPPPAANQADAEVVSFLATLQRRGRFVDFLMDDIAAYTDAQVGAAARVVHDGCKSALTEHLSIRPIREESEGSRVEVPVSHPADEYRLVGNIGGEPPFSGTLVHRGWKTEAVNLPRLLSHDGDRLPTIAPAEVELK